MAPSISAPPAIHWYAYDTLSSPSASAMPDVSAVRVCPTWAVPVTVGSPVAGRLGRASTSAVGSLVRDS